MLQGVGFSAFLDAKMGYDVAALLCCPLHFVKDKGGDRTASHAAHLLKWGPKDDDGETDLDLTAKRFNCFKR